MLPALLEVIGSTDEIRIISAEDLGAVSGGLQVYTGGGGGRMAPHVVSNGPSGSDIVAVGIILGIIGIGLSL